MLKRKKSRKIDGCHVLDCKHSICWRSSCVTVAVWLQLKSPRKCSSAPLPDGHFDHLNLEISIWKHNVMISLLMEQNVLSKLLYTMVKSLLLYQKWRTNKKASESTFSALANVSQHVPYSQKKNRQRTLESDAWFQEAVQLPSVEKTTKKT